MFKAQKGRIAKSHKLLDKLARYMGACGDLRARKQQPMLGKENELMLLGIPKLKCFR